MAANRCPRHNKTGVPKPACQQQSPAVGPVLWNAQSLLTDARKHRLLGTNSLDAFTHHTVRAAHGSSPLQSPRSFKVLAARALSCCSGSERRLQL
jgi:hypothetical protein